MSVVLRTTNERRPAKTANSIAATPRRSRLSMGVAAASLCTIEVTHANSPNCSILQASKDELTAAGNIGGGHGQPCRGASAGRQNAARAVDRDVVHHEHEA